MTYAFSATTTTHPKKHETKIEISVGEQFCWYRINIDIVRKQIKIRTSSLNVSRQNKDIINRHKQRSLNWREQSQLKTLHPIHITSLCSIHRMTFTMDTNLILREVRNESSYSAVSILRVPIIRSSISSEPMCCSEGCFCAGYRIQFKCVSARSRVSQA